MYENRVLLKETEAKQILIESIETFFSKNVSFVRRDKIKQKKKLLQVIFCGWWCYPILN